MSKSNIEWTDETWNVTTGCTRVSAGCDNCYAVAMTKRLAANPYTEEKYSGLINKGKGHFNGRIKLHEDELEKPLHWRKPRMVFVNSMSDLFHPEVPFEFIDKVFAVMALTPQHTYQVLTKRPERMDEYLNTEFRSHQIARAIDDIRVQEKIKETKERWVEIKGYPNYEVSNTGKVRSLNGSLVCCNCGCSIDGVASKRYCGAKCRAASHYRRTAKNVPDKFDPVFPLLLPDIGGDGHQRVTLFKDGERSRELVHRLVLSAFDREPDDVEQGRHLNGEPSCNHIANLAWGSQSDNWDDRKRHGNFRSYSKLKEDQVNIIRDSDLTISELSEIFSVSEAQIINIKEGRQWASESPIKWPLENCWLGTSCENQEAANERIPHLLNCPAAVRFLSCEPLLGEVRIGDVSNWNNGEEWWGKKIPIDWVIVGGESGHNARPMHPDWARSLRDQCNNVGVSFFFKQWGAWLPFNQREAGQISNSVQYEVNGYGSYGTHWKVGKKKAGRLLDGQEWNQMPGVS